MPRAREFDLSVIVIVFNMRREAPRTLYSLSPAYQRDIEAVDYEVIVIDNGSTEPLVEEDVEACGANFRYLYHQTRSPSPVDAVNRGVSLSRSETVMICLDGARILSPGLLAYALGAGRAMAPGPAGSTPVRDRLAERRLRVVYGGHPGAIERRRMVQHSGGEQLFCSA
jgi:glycosyltransferase involved in cell wall biosynthesis